MVKLKKILAASIIAVSLLSVSMGSIASSNLGQNSIDFPPPFLQNTGAVMMTDEQMASVQGEAISIAAVYYAVLLIQNYGIPVATAIWISASQYHLPTFWVGVFYNRYFG